MPESASLATEKNELLTQDVLPQLEEASCTVSAAGESTGVSDNAQ